MIDSYDPLEYFPIKQGMPKSSSAFSVLPKYENEEKNKIFQIDYNFSTFRNEKENRRSEIREYYQATKNAAFEEVIPFIIDTLSKEYPQYFTYIKEPDGSSLLCKLTKEVLIFDKNFRLIKLPEQNYLDAFDALAMQVPEDLAIMSVDVEGNARLEAAHLCTPNDWAANFINKNFEEIHESLPNFKKIIPNSQRLLRALMKTSKTIERVGAINFKTTPILNRSSIIPKEIRFPPLDDKSPKLFMRWERQTLTTFPKSGVLLFSIKTYVENCLSDDLEKRPAFIRVFEEKKSGVHSEKFINDNREQVLRWLKK